MQENCLFNKYRLYTLNEYFDGQLIIGGAFFEDECRYEDNYGDLIIFQIGVDINENTQMQELLYNQVIRHFTAHGLSYHSDEFPPTIRVSQVTNPLNAQETFIIAVIS